MNENSYIQDMKKNLYIISGCNGAGKTTASYSILPEILACKEFVNADEIAKGLSPFQPEKVSIEAGRIMLNRIRELIQGGEDFAFETTLATRSYVHTIKAAKEKGYNVILLFFWLQKIDLAIERVKERVKEGGHNITEDVIKRRYKKALLSDKNRTLISLSFCLDTKERKNQVSIEAVRRKFLSDRYSKRVYALAYKRQALFGIGAASKFSSTSLRQSRPRSAEPIKSF